MGPAEGSNAVDGRVTRPGAGGVVSRTGLFERLGASARVTVISAPPGSGKSVLLRSWIGEAGLMDSTTEIRVLRYLPTNLSAPEIARELSVSVHTVRTHTRHLFAKLGAHGRTEAVTRARALGLLAPSGRTS